MWVWSDVPPLQNMDHVSVMFRDDGEQPWFLHSAPDFQAVPFTVPNPKNRWIRRPHSSHYLRKGSHTADN